MRDPWIRIHRGFERARQAWRAFQPSGCWLCQEGFGRALCPACIAALPWTRDPSLPPPGVWNGVDTWIVAQYYQYPWTEWIPELKFQGILARAQVLADCMARAVVQRGPTVSDLDLLIPVPLHPRRYRERGFNQAACLAQILGERFAIPVCDTVLHRSRETQPQTLLSRKQRVQNVRQAFVCAHSLAGLRVGVVEDVVTTGATLQSVLTALDMAGPASRAVWVGCTAQYTGGG